MSKSSLLIVAGASAALGAVTALALRRDSPRASTNNPTIVASSNNAPTLPSASVKTIGVPSYPNAINNSTTVAPAKPSPVDPSGLFAYGFPGPVNDLKVGEALVSSFNRATRNPSWVAEHITPASLLIQDGDRRHSQFYEDTSIPEKFRAKLSDYFRSGYDRGHQVPAADAKWSQSAMDSTFSLANMCPQVGEGFNRDYWAHFEDFCRRLTTFYPSVRIVTGPLYLPKRDADGKWRISYEVVGHPPNVAVPTHFYKLILAEDGKVGGQVSLAAFVLPNDRIPNDKPLKDFEVPIEALERASGLEFASLLPPARRKKLCEQVSCSIIVKEYAERQRTMRTPPPAKLPPPQR